MSDLPPFVEFLESHRPPLEAGEYRISVTQKFSEKPNDDAGPLETFGEGQSYHFSVAGPKYMLSPQDIAAAFPPPGSLGDHSNVFPHVAFHRSTLPWERSADAAPNVNPGDWTGAPTPWLALLVCDEDDLKNGNIRAAPSPANQQALKVSTLDAADAEYPFADAAQGDTAVAAVDIRSSQLKAFLPTALECRLLCHVRRNILFSFSWPSGRPPPVTADLQSYWPADLAPSDRATIESTGEGQNCWRFTDAAHGRSFLLWENTAENTLQVTDETDPEYAFVIGNRLPKAGKTTTVHLISLEGRFGDTGEINASQKDYTRFVSLYQWQFSCESHKHTFEGLLLHLNQTLAPGTQPALRLPPNQDGATEIRLAAGFSLLPHQFRDGSQSYSWYRGPLAPGPTYLDVLPLPVVSSDELLTYDNTAGLFYTGYAAAWELGRLLCLANSRVSQALFQWKREDRRTRRQAVPEHAEKLRLLPLDLPGDSDRLPAVVSDWFDALRRLEPVPFRYLVPDERMLPVESIRFFEIDKHWTDCLIDGAFSIGRVLDGDHKHDKTLHEELSGDLHHGQDSQNPITGFLLRSAAVSGWPLMTVDGVSSNGTAVERLRFDRLAPDILLCLFKGSPTSFEVHLPQETIHFGIEADEKGGFRPTRETEIRIKDLMRLGMVLRGWRLRVNGRPSPELNPAEFARRMVEGVPKVIFKRQAA
jgi:hypothetical protein